MPVVGTKGAMSSQGFGEFAQVNAIRNYIEDVFSTYLYTGNGTSQTITNNIDLLTKGGLTWIKSRNDGLTSHSLFDTVRGANVEIQTNTANPNDVGTQYLTAFTTSGFSVGSGTRVNTNANTYVSWSFIEQPKFFDVVTWSGDGTGPRNIAHNLGSAPACMLIKDTTNTANWFVYHSGLNGGTTPEQYYITLNATSAQTFTGSATWNGTAPTASVFSIGNAINAVSSSYVAYIFASNAGGFGLSTTDNVISCGSYTGNGVDGTLFVNLGWEPQWILLKRSNGLSDWGVVDNMRGLTATGGSSALTIRPLLPNRTSAETNGNIGARISSTGFYPYGATSNWNTSGATYIYMAIRRGPMKPPTSGTAVFGMSARTGTGANVTVTSGQIADAVIIKNRGSAVDDLFATRLTNTGYLVTSTTASEGLAAASSLQANPWDVMDGVKVGTTSTTTNASANTFINYVFKRAPSFFDVVCYTGTGSATTFTHNLAVVPELIIVKARTNPFAAIWCVYHSSLGATKGVYLSAPNAQVTTSSFWNNTDPTSSVFTIGTLADINSSGYTNIAYLFATCAGVSKVGSYRGNGSTQTIDCGFGASGARFVLIKCSTAIGNWYIYDTARGMTSLTDPYWLANTSAAEVATLGSVRAVSTGFALDASILLAINGGVDTYIFLAIA